MNSKNVIPWDAMPASAPLLKLALIWLLLDRFSVNDIVWGIFYTLGAIWVVGWLVCVFTQKQRPLVGYGRDR